MRQIFVCYHLDNWWSFLDFSYQLVSSTSTYNPPQATHSAPDRYGPPYATPIQARPSNLTLQNPFIRSPTPTYPAGHNTNPMSQILAAANEEKFNSNYSPMPPYPAAWTESSNSYRWFNTFTPFILIILFCIYNLLHGARSQSVPSFLCLSPYNTFFDSTDDCNSEQTKDSMSGKMPATSPQQDSWFNFSAQPLFKNATIMTFKIELEQEFKVTRSQENVCYSLTRRKAWISPW